MPIVRDVAEGFIQTTRFRTLSRLQHSFRADEDYARLRERAERQASLQPPHPHRMLFVIVPRIEADLVAADGRPFHAASLMTSAEIDHCRACFGSFMEMVSVFTEGALRIEATEWMCERPVRRMSSPGQGLYWLSAADSLADDLEQIPEDTFDSIGVYYKMPPGVRAALHGGAVGSDHGVRGSAYWTLWITSWDEIPGPFSRTAIASLHEWLHNVSHYAHHILGESAIPDCHAGEEYGYWDLDGGYPQWQAWNRDLMLRYTPRSFWRRLTARREQVVRAVPAAFSGAFYRWQDVADDWMRRLPRLDDPDLRRATGLPDLRIETGQRSPNSHMIWGLRTSARVPSPYHAGPLSEAPCRLDNVLALTRLPQPTLAHEAHGGYADAPIESLAWLRSPSAATDRRDLVLVRPDVAPAVLERLRVVGPRASERLIGYVNRQDPSEGQQVNVLAAAVDFGSHPPLDELEAVGVAVPTEARSGWLPAVVPAIKAEEAR